jgi:UrcA family protein
VHRYETWSTVACFRCFLVRGTYGFQGNHFVPGGGGVSGCMRGDSVAVNVKNVNFDQPAEVAALYRRIAYAADRVCGPHNVPGFHFESPRYTACHDKAVNDAVTSLGRPELTAYYQERVGGNSQHLASQ